MTINRIKSICLLAIGMGLFSSAKAQVVNVLVDIFNGSSGSTPATGASNATATANFPKVGNKVVFRASDGTTGANSWMHGTELYILDMSQAVTANGGTSGTPWSSATNPRLFDLFPNNPSTTSKSSAPQEFVQMGNVVYFVATNGANGQELWKLDLGSAITDSASVYGGAADRYGIGTNPGVIDLQAGTTSSSPVSLYPYNGKLYFGATPSSAVGLEFWVYDPSQAISNNNGTSSFTSSTNPKYYNVGTDDAGVLGGCQVGTFAQGFLGTGGKIYFTGTSSLTYGAELFVYDPTTGDMPSVVAEVNPFRGTTTGSKVFGSTPQYLTDVNGKIFYRCQGADTASSSGGFDAELWVYNPSAAITDSSSLGGPAGRFGIGTNPGMVKDINPAVKSNGFSSTGFLTLANPGTGELGLPYRIPQINGVVYFAANDVVTGSEVWRSDGTTAGTYRVKDIFFNNTAGSGPGYIYSVYNKLIFNAYYGDGKGCMWMYDPTQDTTASITLSNTTNPALINNIGLITSSGTIRKVTGINGLIYMQIGLSPNYDNELAILDPGVAISSSLNSSSNPKWIDINTGASQSTPTYFTDINGTMVFQGNNGVKGSEMMSMNIYNPITASAGANGSITLNGTTNVNYGYNQTYTITPSNGYCVDSLIVDGVKVTSATTYTFNNVIAAHTIRATFALIVAPTVTISTATTTVCSGNSVTFNTNSTNGGVSPVFEWRKNGNNVGSGSSIAFTPGTLSSGDIITCVLTASNPCLSTVTSNSITVTVIQSPNVATITSQSGTLTSATFCTLGESRYFYASLPNGTWSSTAPSVASVSNTGLVSSVSNGNTAIKYTITSTSNGTGCSSDAIVNVTVASVPTPNAITGNNEVCAGNTIALSTTSTGGVWSSSNNKGTINAGGVYTGVNAGAGEARYTITNASNCSSYASKSITVNAKPGIPSISYAPGTVNPQYGAAGNYCTNKTFTVVGTPGGGVWSKTGVISVTTPAGVVSTGNTPGAGSLTYTYTTAGGCSSSRTIASNVVSCASRSMNAATETMSSNLEYVMYPNPARASVNISVDKLVGNGQIVITDLYGKQLKTQTLSMGSNSVNIEKLAKGFYFVSIVTNEGKKTEKLIVE